MEDNKKIEEVISKFKITGNMESARPFGSGHINDTYRIVNADAASPDYLLQRINHEVFRDVPALMKNIVAVTGHIKAKMNDLPGNNPEKQVLTLIPTLDGQYYYQDAVGYYWRLYIFLKDTRSYDIVQSVELAREGGRAFGDFQNLLADFDVHQLTSVIPDFHNVLFRLHQFERALQNDSANRASLTRDEIAFVKNHYLRMSEIEEMGRSGQLTLRITHNDTKFNNVLFSKNGTAQCVIDLDTVMPGYLAFDFGDAVRTIINTAAEDEPDLQKITLNIPLFRAFTTGFLERVKDKLSDAEISSLAKGILLLPFLMGLRFTTDYLNGDTYYKTKFPGHNLQRARAQFRLVSLLEQHCTELENIVKNALKNDSKDSGPTDVCKACIAANSNLLLTPNG